MSKRPGPGVILSSTSLPRDASEHQGAASGRLRTASDDRILLVAALGFLGLGMRPPAADWGLMVGENRLALMVQPWPVSPLSSAISLLTIGVNLAIDGIGRRTGSIPHPAESRV